MVPSQHLVPSKSPPHKYCCCPCHDHQSVQPKLELANPKQVITSLSSRLARTLFENGQLTSLAAAALSDSSSYFVGVWKMPVPGFCSHIETGQITRMRNNRDCLWVWKHWDCLWVCEVVGFATRQERQYTHMSPTDADSFKFLDCFNGLSDIKMWGRYLPERISLGEACESLLEALNAWSHGQWAGREIECGRGASSSCLKIFQKKCRF